MSICVSALVCTRHRLHTLCTEALGAGLGAGLAVSSQGRISWRHLKFMTCHFPAGDLQGFGV